jgi:hypothetical protein
LPQKGNYCIGISANPFFTYFGNKLENQDTGFRRLTDFGLSTSFSIGFRGFVGVKYFIAPNFSFRR